MAAFSTASSYQQQLLDYSAPPSIFQHPINTPSNINGLLVEPNNNNALFFPQFYQPDHQNQYLDQSTKVSSADDLVTNSTDTTNINEASVVLSVTNKNCTAAATSMDTSSIVTDHKYYDSSGKLPTTTQKPIPMDKKRKSKEGSSASCAQSKDMREVKGKKQKKVKDGDEEKKEAPEGYIHVRARRGQATDSHSLAERVRRERISERMKLLQALVPGCEKVTGKALMLDEIINYVQSLQNQVEFLSMKLASVNPMLYDFGMDLESFMVKPHDQNLSSLPSQLPSSMQQCSPTAAHNYQTLLLDNIISPNPLIFQQQSQIPDALPQGNRQVLWEVDDQIRQNVVVNQSRESGIISNSLFSFH